MVFAGCEDFGIALAEAQACGTPLIAFGRGGACDIVRPLGGAEQPTGVLFARQTVAALKDAVGRVRRESAGRSRPLACRDNAEPLLGRPLRPRDPGRRGRRSRETRVPLIFRQESLFGGYRQRRRRLGEAVGLGHRLEIALGRRAPAEELRPAPARARRAPPAAKGFRRARRNARSRPPDRRARRRARASPQISGMLARSDATTGQPERHRFERRQAEALDEGREGQAEAIRRAAPQARRRRACRARRRCRPAGRRRVALKTRGSAHPDHGDPEAGCRQPVGHADDQAGVLVRRLAADEHDRAAVRRRCASRPNGAAPSGRHARGRWGPRRSCAAWRCRAGPARRPRNATRWRPAARALPSAGISIR